MLLGKGWSVTREVVEILLDAGCDIYAKDEEGKTAMRLAYVAGADDVVALLAERGAERCPEIVTDSFDLEIQPVEGELEIVGHLDSDEDDDLDDDDDDLDDDDDDDSESEEGVIVDDVGEEKEMLKRVQEVGDWYDIVGESGVTA